MAIQTNFPAVKPALLLDFAKNKRLDPRITFTRTTTATYYDAVTTAKAEENLLSQSQTFTTATWSHNGISTTANTSTAPDGTTTATTITEDAALNSHLIIKYSTLLGTGTYTLSIFAKLGTGSRFLTIGFNRASNFFVSATFDLSAGTNTQTLISGYTNASATITAAAQGFYRCTVTATIDSAVDVRVGLSSTGTHTSDSRGFKSYTGNGTDSLIIWGAQIEQRSSATAYTATTTEPITNYIPVLQTAAAGQARFDHDPVTRESLGLLVEEQRTNLLTYSAEFDNAAWTKALASITSNTIVAPDGTSTGDKLVEDTTASDVHRIDQLSITVVSGTTYAASIYLKAAERTKARIVYLGSGTSGVYADADLSAGTIGAATAFNTAAAVTSSIQSVGNGWYRCTVVGSQSVGTSGSFRIEMLDASGNRTYTGDGTSGIYIWGAQLEAGAFPTSYIPTVAATATRNADAATMTGTNFSSWFNAAEGTVYFESQSVQGTNSYPYSLFGSSTSNRIFSNYTTNSRMVAGIRVNVTFEAAVTTPNNSAPINTFGKGALAYKVNDFGFSWNGAAALTDTSTTLPIIQKLDIGNNGGLVTNWLNGTIKKIAYYPLRITNANLQALTS
jgi:hypothetical protein